MVFSKTKLSKISSHVNLFIVKLLTRKSDHLGKEAKFFKASLLISFDGVSMEKRFADQLKPHYQSPNKIEKLLNTTSSEPRQA